MKLKYKYLLSFLFVMLFVSMNAHAQCDPFFDPFCEDVDMPLDTEAVYALIIAAIAGAWFILKRKKIKQLRAE